MKKALFALLIFISCFTLYSCEDNRSNDKVISMFDEITSSMGGKVVVYNQKSAEVPKALISLYGRDNNVPDELALVDFAAVWYSNRMDAGDLAFFYVPNISDIDSVKKMCQRRANTIKYAAGIDMEIHTDGHFVYAYTINMKKFATSIVKTIKT